MNEMHRVVLNVMMALSNLLLAGGKLIMKILDILWLSTFMHLMKTELNYTEERGFLFFFSFWITSVP